jgi:hypothetical protein
MITGTYCTTGLQRVMSHDHATFNSVLYFKSVEASYNSYGTLAAHSQTTHYTLHNGCTVYEN